MLLPPVHLRVKLFGTFSDPEVWIDTGIYSIFNLKNNYKIKPHFKIADLGCGVGRLVVPFMSFLNSEGHYYGLDVDKEMIDWCNENYKPVAGNMTFDWADVENKQYFPDGTASDANYVFPYEDKLLDFGFAFSLFTHLLEPGARNYLNEISRTLKPKGKFMLSTFLLNETSLLSIANGNCQWSLSHSYSPICKYEQEACPVTTVAYTEEGMRQMIADAGLKIESILYGGWSSIKGSHHQDEILVVKS